MRIPVIFLASIFFCLPAYAMHCPNDMAKIDQILANDPPPDKDVLRQVTELRTEGQEAHEAGNHQEAVDKLGEALEILKAETGRDAKPAE
ncbi:hypothetical protein SAMN05216421_0298 [Halopseudomonas xinjiangensis]|uniref:Tetratricopeptide repeat-containing protein n=1 Tax=Halopseudomonas xinjiangensis TaxID=487184 RepID=A0A1H1LUU3_9GAMM|nr:hypothetical protein [Halopseudomonas xinjiangensis]SDR78273.1 hypothetical protein SAMN05216421_0298 [Halopseudomonas xinjiangensis]